MPGYQKALPELIDVLKPYAKEGQVLTEDTHLLTDLGLDSMKVMQLILETEERFDISIPLNVLTDVRTVKDFAHQIEHLTEQH